MSLTNTTLCSVRSYFAGKIFWLSADISEDEAQYLNRNIKLLGGTVAASLNSDVDYVVTERSDPKATRKAVEKLNKSGGKTTIVLSVRLKDLLQLSHEQLSEIFEKGDREAWNCLKTWLRGFTLVGAQLQNSDLSSYEFPSGCSNVDFRNAKMTSVYLRDVSDCNFEGADLTSARCANFLRNSSFRQATMVDSLISASVSDCDFSQANITRLSTTSSVEPIWFRRCNFTKSSLAEADLEQCKFFACTLENTDFSNAQLCSANFDGAKLTKTTFKNANLFNASFAGADLTEVDFEGAMLLGADFRNAKFANTAFNNALLAGAARFDETITGSTTVAALKIPQVVQSRGENLARADVLQTKCTAIRFEATVLHGPFHITLKVQSNDKGSKVEARVNAVIPESNLTKATEVTTKGFSTMSEAFLSITKGLTDVTLDAESVRVFSTNKVKDDRLFGIALFYECLGQKPPSLAELKDDALQKEEAAKRLRNESLLLFKSAKGISTWNAKSLEERRAIDLVQHDFSNLDLTGIDLSNLALDKCNFSGSILKNANLTHSELNRALFAGACLDGADLTEGELHGADFTGASLRQAKLDKRDLWNCVFQDAVFEETSFKSARILGCNLACAKLVSFDCTGAGFNRTTVFPPDFKLDDSLVWWGRGVDPRKLAIIEAQLATEPYDFDSFMTALKKEVDTARFKKVLAMLKSDSFQLFAEVTADKLCGIVKSQTDNDLVYACYLDGAGQFGCCTQNLKPCGGLRGALCKHIYVLLIGLARSNQVDPSTAFVRVLQSSSNEPTLDKDQMSETFVRYKGSEVGDIDWRPTETTPEDYYAY